MYLFDYRYAYLVGPLIILSPIWLYLYFARKDLRREMLLISCAVAILSPYSELIFIQDYWHPETFTNFATINGYPWPILEDMFFGFFYGGIATSIYEFVFRFKLYASTKLRNQRLPKSLFIIFIIFLCLLVLPFKLWDINSIYTSFIACAGVAIFILFLRHDLIKDALVSGFLFALIMFLGYLVFLKIYPLAIERWWLLDNISGIFVINVPIEEILLAFGWGLMIGPLYEFLVGLRLQHSSE